MQIRLTRIYPIGQDVEELGAGFVQVVKGIIRETEIKV